MGGHFHRAGAGIDDRVLERLADDAHRHPQLPDHLEHILHAARPQPRRHQAPHRHRRHDEHLGYGRVWRARVQSLLPRLPLAISPFASRWCGGFCSPRSPPGSSCVRGLGTRSSPWAATPPALGRLESRSKRVKIGLFMGVGFLAWFYGMHRLYAFSTVQSGEGVGNEFLLHHRGRRRRVPAHAADTAPRSAPRSARSSSA